MKSVIREILAMIILIAAIVLLMLTFFFDYIKAETNQPQAAIYKMSENEVNILKERQNYIESQNKIVLSSAYSLDESDLEQYKVTNQLKTGQSNPFDEIPITDIIFDAEGNAYYMVSTNRDEGGNVIRKGTVSGTTADTSNENDTQNTTKQNTNNVVNNTVYQPDKDITAPSSSSGNLTKGNGGK